jgi:hypothetical protein
LSKLSAKISAAAPPPVGGAQEEVSRGRRKGMRAVGGARGALAPLSGVGLKIQGAEKPPLKLRRWGRGGVNRPAGGWPCSTKRVSGVGGGRFEGASTTLWAVG